ncbi:MAG: hypothetical protein QRY72_00285 [Candidatus Rhabdochlamydia sp.]
MSFMLTAKKYFHQCDLLEMISSHLIQRSEEYTKTECEIEITNKFILESKIIKQIKNISIQGDTFEVIPQSSFISLNCCDLMKGHFRFKKISINKQYYFLRELKMRNEKPF